MYQVFIALHIICIMQLLYFSSRQLDPLSLVKFPNKVLLHCMLCCVTSVRQCWYGSFGTLDGRCVSVAVLCWLWVRRLFSEAQRPFCLDWQNRLMIVSALQDLKQQSNSAPRWPMQRRRSRKLVPIVASVSCLDLRFVGGVVLEALQVHGVSL